jgi:hypothetical protein
MCSTALPTSASTRALVSTGGRAASSIACPSSFPATVNRPLSRAARPAWPSAVTSAARSPSLRATASSSAATAGCRGYRSARPCAANNALSSRTSNVSSPAARTGAIAVSSALNQSS